MTRGEVRTLVRKRLGETTAAFWTDTQLNTWINDGTRDIAYRAKCDRKNSYLTITEGVGEYAYTTISPDIYSILEVYHKNEGTTWIKLDSINRTDLDAMYEGWRNADSSTPWRYYADREENLFGLYPAPNAANAGVSYIRVYHTYKPDPITTGTGGDSVELSIPEPLHLCAVEYVVATGFDSRGWGDRANDVWQKYYQKMKDYQIERHREREDDDLIMKPERNIW